MGLGVSKGQIAGTDSVRHHFFSHAQVKTDDQVASGVIGWQMTSGKEQGTSGEDKSGCFGPRERPAQLTIGAN